MDSARRPWWQQATALVTVSAGGVITGFNFAPGTAATMTTPAGVPMHLLALEKSAAGDLGGSAGEASGGARSGDATLRPAIVNIARHYLQVAQGKTPAEMEALIWGSVSPDGSDHGPFCAAFASLTLELAAQAVGQQSWVTGGGSYPWPLHSWADVRVDANPSSMAITSIVQDAQAHDRWHPAGAGYVPRPGDWVLFDQHVEVVTSYSDGVLHTIGANAAPDYTVDAHAFHGSLAADGVAGFVDNGHLATAPASGERTDPGTGKTAGPAAGSGDGNGNGNASTPKAGKAPSDPGTREQPAPGPADLGASGPAPAVKDAGHADIPGLPPATGTVPGGTQPGGAQPDAGQPGAGQPSAEVPGTSWAGSAGTASGESASGGSKASQPRRPAMLRPAARRCAGQPGGTLSPPPARTSLASWPPGPRRRRVAPRRRAPPGRPQALARGRRASRIPVSRRRRSRVPPQPRQRRRRQQPRRQPPRRQQPRRQQPRRQQPSRRQRRRQPRDRLTARRTSRTSGTPIRRRPAPRERARSRRSSARSRRGRWRRSSGGGCPRR